MSILRSYINKNNTIISNSYANTARNPVMQLNFGYSDLITPNYGFTRFIFDLDLDYLREQISSGWISTGCTTGMTHFLQMTNTASFDEDLINEDMSDGKRRASSFDLILFRIPKSSGTTGEPQQWDEGVGYDYVESNKNQNGLMGGLYPITYVDPRSYSDRPSSWYMTTNVSDWSQPGIYNNTNSGLVNFSGLTVVDRQHFEFGNEDINFDMTEEINNILFGTLTGVTGWGISYLPDMENITGLTIAYSVGYFTRHTQTFYQPFLQTTYDDLIEDDRNNFVKNQTNKLYLYIYENGVPVNLDEPPYVRIEDRVGTVVPSMNSLSTCSRTKGVYEVEVPNGFSGYSSPCEFFDIWSGLTINGQSLGNVTNQFVLKDYSARVQIGTKSKEPEKFGFDFYGILQDEKILNTDIRKVGVTIKKSYSTQQLLQNLEAFYRIYVREGNTEVQVQDWTPINRTPNEYYFIFDTRDKIPNQYYVDIRVNISGDVDTYKKQLTFQIVNKK
jgi:hypothetical protein